MADETKVPMPNAAAVAAFERLSAATKQIATVPTGWVRLTPRACSAELLVRASEIVCVIGAVGGSDITVRGRTEGEDAVRETPAEVAALIDAAQRAQRRFDAVPVGGDDE